MGRDRSAEVPERRPNHAHVLTRPEAMAVRLKDHPEAVAETVRLAETLRFQMPGDLGYRYPMAESPDAIRKLAEVCHALFAARYPAGYRAAMRPPAGSRGAAHHRLSRPGRVLLAAPRDPRAGAGRRPRGPRREHRQGAPVEDFALVAPPAMNFRTGPTTMKRFLLATPRARPHRARGALGVTSMRTSRQARQQPAKDLPQGPLAIGVRAVVHRQHGDRDSRAAPGK